MNILVAGIPTLPLITMIKARNPGELKLYVAESRPYEVQVAQAIAALAATGVSVTVVTDNMIAALMETVGIHEVWSQYLKIDGGQAIAVNGALMSALLARAYEIPCILYPIADLPDGNFRRFAGEDITVAGAKSIDWEPDIIPLTFISEVIANG